MPIGTLFKKARCAAEDAGFNLIGFVGRKLAGLERMSIEFEPGCKLSFYDNRNTNAGETLVLLHGFNADKDHWLLFSSYFKDYRVIIPDLAGHGDSWYDEAITYDVGFQVQIIRRLTQALGVESFHLIGNSMGGWIAAQYCLEHPISVDTLCVLNACGVKSPSLSPFFEKLKRGENSFYFDNRKGFNEFTRLGVESAPFSPWPVMAVQARQAIARQSIVRKMFVDIMNEQQDYFDSIQMLDANLKNIAHPALVIWGQQDRMMNVSMAEIFARELPNAELIIMDQVGHVPMLERPRATANLCRDFLAFHLRFSKSAYR